MAGGRITMSVSSTIINLRGGKKGEKWKLRKKVVSGEIVGGKYD